MRCKVAANAAVRCSHGTKPMGENDHRLKSILIGWLDVDPFIPCDSPAPRGITFIKWGVSISWCTSCNDSQWNTVKGRDSWAWEG